MLNAWVNDLFPLAIPKIIALVPVAILLKIRGRLRHGGGSRLGTVVAGCAGVWTFVVGGTISLGILLTSPTPWERERSAGPSNFDDRISSLLPPRLRASA